MLAQALNLSPMVDTLPGTTPLFLSGVRPRVPLLDFSQMLKDQTVDYIEYLLWIVVNRKSQYCHKGDRAGSDQQAFFGETSYNKAKIMDYKTGRNDRFAAVQSTLGPEIL
ncbi:Hypothetical predicted protein [Scomber scombrus]|uniref:Uncharacterized protein n=1 Tax=Scomber scombrus TaxID=13677 RepID=A0AAV1MXH8_SCOSC